MAAENSLRFAMARIGQCSSRHFFRHTQPPRVQPVDQPRNRFALEINFLQLQIERSRPSAQPHPVHLESVELVSVNRDVPQPAITPRIVLIHAYTDQVRHDVRQSVVVISLDPDNFNFSLRIRQLADVAEKLPVFLRKSRKIQVGEDIAQQYQPLEPILPEHPGGLARAARLSPEVQVRKDQRVVDMQIHISVVTADC
jgi:hypothetical protein